MTDFANLVVTVDSTGVAKGVASLDGLTAAGARAEAATVGLGKGSKTAAAAATAMAAQAQMASRAAVGMATGVASAGMAANNARIAMLDMTHVGINMTQMLASGVNPMRALVMESGRIATAVQFSAGGIRGLVKQAAEWIGILKTTTDAELVEEAANAAGAATAVRSAAQRAAGAIAAADTELALAQAAVRVAATSEAEALAQAQVGAAHEAVAAAAAQATVAENALAVAMDREAAAASASAAATTVAISPIGVALIGVATAAAIAFGTFKLFQAEVNKSGELQKYADGLGLTTKEMEKLKDVTVTLPDVFKGLWKTVADHTIADESLRNFKNFAINQFKLLLHAGVDVFAELYGDIVGTYRGIVVIWQNFPAALGDAFYSAVNAAIGAINTLLSASVGGVNSFIGKVNGIFGTSFATLAAPHIEAVKNAYAGAGKAVAGALKSEISKATAEAKSSARGLIAEVERNIVQASKSRIKAQADEIIGDHNGAKAKAEHAKKAQELKDELAKLTAEYHNLLNAMQVDAFDTKNPAKLDLGIADAMQKLPDLSAQIVNALKAITDQAQVTGQILADAFGKPGEVIGGLLANVAQYGELQKKYADDVAARTMEQSTAEKQLATFRNQTIGATLSGLKSLFKEHSAGYNAMAAAEKAFAIIQAISAIKSVAAGAAKMFSQLGVFAFPAIAAMVAVMAGFGFSGGSSTQAAPTSADDLQKAAGTGTILGDSAAKSASIADSLSLMAKNSTKALDYSDGMLRQLRSIASNIGNLAASVARQLQLQGGFFDTTGKVGTNSSGGLFGIGGLFSSTTTNSLYDQGVKFNPATVGQIMQQGITGATYQVIETIKKNSGFLGIGGSTKTSYSTSTGALGDDITSQINAIIAQLNDSVVSAAKVLGLDVADAIKSFSVQIGQISFKDLTGQQITDQLNAVFSKVGDQMAGFAVSGLAGFQKAGEGLFETLMRLAKDYLTVDAALRSIGMTFPTVGAASIAAREKLIDLAGGLGAFTDQVNFFYDHFISGAAKLAMEQSEIDAAFTSLGISAPPTIDAFASLVKGLNLSTDAGQSMFAALMQIAPAFYDVAAAADALAKKQADLQVQLLQAQGNTAGATALQRQIALAALDPSLQDLQKQIWATQDAAAAAAAALDLQKKAEEAAAAAAEQKKQAIATARDNLTQAYQREADALHQTIDKFRGFAATLREFRDSLFAGDGSGSTSGALVQLMKQAGLANAGNEGALGGGLQTAAQSYLDSATASAGSLQDVQRARALVARYLDQAIGGADSKATTAEKQLSALDKQVSKLVDINNNVLTVAQAIKALTKLMFPTTKSGTAGTAGSHSSTLGDGAGKPVEKALEDIRDRLGKILTATETSAVHAHKTARVLGNADRGGALALVTDADAPIKTTAV